MKKVKRKKSLREASYNIGRGVIENEIIDVPIPSQKLPMWLRLKAKEFAKQYGVSADQYLEGIRTGKYEMPKNPYKPTSGGIPAPNIPGLTPEEPPGCPPCTIERAKEIEAKKAASVVRGAAAPPPMRPRLGGQPAAKPAAKPAVPSLSYPAILGGDSRYEYLYQQIAEDIKDEKELEEIAKKIAAESKDGNRVSARSFHFTNIKKDMGLTTEDAIDMLLNKNPQKLKKFEQFMRDKKIGAYLGVAEEILPINTVRELTKMIPESLRLNRIKLADILF